MPTWRTLDQDLAGDAELAAMTDSQVEAVVDVLALTIHADECVAPIEVAGFNHLVFDLPWIQPRRDLVRSILPEAVSRARSTAGDDAARRALARDAAARLEGQSLREKVFRMAVSLAAVDFDVVPAEARALEWLAEAFGLEAGRVRAILETLEKP